MRKILVIEDEYAVRESICELLELENYKVFSAHDGEQGIRIALSEFPDLIISDIMMPNVNGFEVLQALRENLVTSSIPFIFLSAKTDKSDQRFGMELGADDFLTKPFSRGELYNAISSRLARHEALNLKAREKFEQLKTNLTFTLPHEFRTPLTGILATSQFLLQNGDDLNTKDLNELYTSIYQSAKRLNKLVSNYLSHAELELKKSEVKPSKNELQNVCDAPDEILIEAFRSAANEHGRLDDLEYTSQSASIFVHPHDYLKICQELADNAFKFSQNGKRVIISCGISGKHYQVTVTDFGIGFDPVKIRDIESYTQFDRKNMEQQGVGLGLSLVKKLCEVYDAEFDIESVIGSYSKIIINFALVK